MDHPPVIDLLHSWFYFRTSSTFDHTPRMQLAASCRVERPGAEPVVAYLSHPCIAETMYAPSDLIQEPVAQFTAIVIDGQELAFLRRTVEDARESRSTIRLGAQMPTHSGVPASMLEIRVVLREATGVAPLHGYAAMRDAILGGARMAGRTTFTWNGATVTLDYPATTVNIANDREAWQVDAGPVLLPTRTAAGDGLAVDAMEPGYLVFNRPDWAEITSLGGDGPARPLRIQTTTELFTLD
jgi:hypothetical protein